MKGNRLRGGFAKQELDRALLAAVAVDDLPSTVPVLRCGVSLCERANRGIWPTPSDQVSALLGRPERVKALFDSFKGSQSSPSINFHQTSMVAVFRIGGPNGPTDWIACLILTGVVTIVRRMLLMIVALSK